MTNLPSTTRGRCVLGALCVALLAACGASDAEIHRAKTSAYQADFATVYSQALGAVRDLYPQIAEDAAAGQIKTAWHPVRITTGTGDDDQAVSQDPTGGPMAGIATARGHRKYYFIRFDVFVVGGNPWRVRVRGQASAWRPGEVPTPLRGAEIPHWLKGRTEALQVAIYRRLKQHAVPLEVERVERDRAAPAESADPTRFGDLPPEAVDVVGRVHAAARARSHQLLRGLMADDFVWADGEAPSADVAVAMWQADPGVLSGLAEALEGGCAVEGEAIVCGEARFRQVGGTWRLARFAPGR